MIKLTKTLFYFSLFVILSSTANASEKRVVCAERHYTHSPLMSGIDKAVLASGTIPREYDQKKLPQILQKENLEKLVADVHRDIFRVIPKYGYGCFDKRNQPVQIYNYSDRDQRKQYREHIHDPRTLLVFLRVVVHKAEDIGNTPGEDVVSLSVTLANDNVSDFYKSSSPFLFATSMESHLIEQKLREALPKRLAAR